MRFDHLFTVFAINYARASDLCSELCEIHGREICTDGSEVIINERNQEICLNYFTNPDGTYFYDSGRSSSPPLLLEDVPIYIASHQLGRLRLARSAPAYLNGLESTENLRNFDLGESMMQLENLIQQNPHDDAYTRWERIDGRSLLRCLERTIVRNPSAFLLLLRYTASGPPRPVEGWDEFLNSSGLRSFFERRSHTISNFISRVLQKPSRLSYALFWNFQIFFPQLLDHASDSLNLLRIALGPVEQGVLRMEMVDSTEEGYQRALRALGLLNSEEYHGISKKVLTVEDTITEQAPSQSASLGVRWLQFLATKISKDPDWTTDTKNRVTLDMKALKYRAFGRFLAILISNRVTAPFENFPYDILRAILGRTNTGSYGRIAAAFHEVIPLRTLERFVKSTLILKEIFVGPHGLARSAPAYLKGLESTENLRNFDLGESMMQLENLIQQSPHDDAYTRWERIDGRSLLRCFERTIDRYPSAFLLLLRYTAAGPPRPVEGWDEFLFSSGLRSFFEHQGYTISNFISRVLQKPSRLSYALFWNFQIFFPQLLDRASDSLKLLRIALGPVEQGVLRMEMVDTTEEGYQRALWLLNSEEYHGIAKKVLTVEDTITEQAPSQSASPGVRWLQFLATEISKDPDWTTYTKNRETLDMKALKYRAFGRFLAILISNRVTAPFETVPDDILRAILGQTNTGSYGRIAAAFHEVIPLRTLERFVKSTLILKEIFVGLDGKKRLEVIALRLFEIYHDPLFYTVARMEEQHRRQFVYRCTGTSSIPLDGFPHFRLVIERAPEGASEITLRRALTSRGLLVSGESFIQIPAHLLDLGMGDFLREALLRFINQG